MTISTAMCSSFKGDILSGLHCFNADAVFTADTDGSTAVLTSVSSLTGLAVGMAVSGTGIAAGSVIASIDSATQITLSKDTTAAGSTVAITAQGDTFRAALIMAGMSGTYGAASTNYTDITGNSDETSGTGYVAGGNALTNVSPVVSGTTAFIDFSDVSWTGASFSTAGFMIYNSTRRGPIATRACSVHDFGGTQTVTSGTFTIIFPTADASNAILRIG